MSRHVHRFVPLVLAAVVVVVLALTLGGTASAKKKHKPLKVTCDQLHDQIGQTAEAFRDQYNAMGFTIEEAPYGFLVGGGCKKSGKRTRQGSAFMADVHHSGDGDPPFPGETDPNVVEYHWLWDETLTITKKRKLIDSAGNFRCVKYFLDDSTPSGLNERPC